MTNFENTVIDLVNRIAQAPVIEVCCGSGWLIQGLTCPNAIGVDPMAPADPRFQRLYFSQFMFTAPELWDAAQTIIMCYPPGPADAYTVGLEVIEAMYPGQRLLLIAPKPYEETTVAGTYSMWQKVFSDTILVDEHQIDDCHRLYVLEPGNGIQQDTRKAILKGHDLWQLNGIRYDRYGMPIPADIPTRKA